MLETVMLTSVTRRPTRLSTLLATLRRTASASWGIDLPYSAVSVRSMAASSWPTSTETPWVWLPPLPPVMEPRMPPTAWEAPLPILMPSTSWAAIPATFDTTLSEMLVLPRSVCSGLLLLLWSVMYRSPFVLSALYRPAREQPVDGEQDDGAQRGRQYGREAEAPRAPAEAEPFEHPSADKGAHYPDQGRDHDTSRVWSWHNPLRQDARYEPDHYPHHDGPDAYGFSPPHLHRACAGRHLVEYITVGVLRATIADSTPAG